MKITKGKVKTPLKIIIYGPEGIGKTTFASGMPDPLWIDVEGSSVHMEVARLDRPASWEELIAQVKWVADTKPCKTLVIDSADWVEKLCYDYTVAKNGWDSIETPGYGKGFTIASENFNFLIHRLNQVIESGINVILTAHAIIKKFDEPDQMGAYDRYELKLDKRNAPALKEWCDILLFANYKTDIITDAKTKTKKATGGHRVMYTTHHPAYDAKNRMGLPEELPLSIDGIAHLLDDPVTPQPAKADFDEPVVEPEPAKQAIEPEPKDESAPEPVETVVESVAEPKKLDERLFDLMTLGGFTREDLRQASGPANLGGLGYWPNDMQVEDYPTDFIDFIVANWEPVAEKLKEQQAPPLDLS